jgi:diacylglycerol kinase
VTGAAGGPQERGWLAARIDSFRHAFRGVGTLVASEPNARIHAFVSVAVVAMACWLGVGRRDFALLILAIASVWAAEAANTALEHLADVASPGPHEGIRKAKDVAAAAVLICALGAALVGLLVLGPPLAARLL